MDDGLSEAVKEAFVRLHEDGLIYRGKRLVNWDTKLHTAISDLEVENHDEKGHLWHLRYPLADGCKTADGLDYLVVATTRPETMLGDTAVAVNPEDARYKHLIGKKVRLPLMDRIIPIIADSPVDRDVGTGRVKVTPAQDPNDCEIGRRHHLEELNVMAEDGSMNEAAGRFSGLDRFGCSVTENADGSWRILITDPALQTASVGDVIERATFDPEWALEDPDVTLLDVGHPLVRRLIEEVKQNTFREVEHYGRTACVVTPDVEEVTALFHLLARYVVNTEPTSIVEELLPVAVPVYGGEPLDPEATRRLLCATPSPETRTEAEVREALADALGMEGLERLLSDAVENRRRALVAERRRMRQQMEEREGTRSAEWVKGIDQLSPGSFDVLGVTLLWPE